MTELGRRCPKSVILGDRIPSGCLNSVIRFSQAQPYLNCGKTMQIRIYIYIIQILSVCLSSIGGQTAGPIMTKFGTHMRIDLGMVPTKYWPHEWPGSVGSLGPISESGLSCQLLLRAVVWQMTSQLIRRRNDVVFAAFNQPVSVRPMNVQKINKTNVYPPHPGGSSVPGGGWGVNISKVREISRTAEKIDKKKFCRKNNQNM